VACFGVPGRLTSDRGPQFTSAIWQTVCQLLDIKAAATTAYRPQANGLLERFHRRLKDALRAVQAGSDWARQLPLLLLVFRATPREDVERSPAEAVYGSQLVLPSQLLGEADPPPGFLQQLDHAMAGFKPIPARHNVAEGRGLLPSPPDRLMAARRVFVRRGGSLGPLEAVWEGPFPVLQRSPTGFRIRRGQKEDTVSIHRIKPAPDELQVPDAAPRRRGRPPHRRVRFLLPKHSQT